MCIFNLTKNFFNLLILPISNLPFELIESYKLENSFQFLEIKMNDR